MIVNFTTARLFAASSIALAGLIMQPSVSHALDIGVSVGGGSSGGGVSAGVSVDGGRDSGRSDRSQGSGNDRDRGSRGVNASVDVGGGRGIDADADVRVGGRDGVRANANVGVGGGNGVQAGVDVGVGGGNGVDADVDIGIGGGNGGTGGSGGGGSVNPDVLRNAVANMSEGQIAAYRNQCRDVLRRPQRHDRDLVALCQIVLELQQAQR